ncbi:MAG: hypothetical protein PHV12_01055 [Bacteroidales bacterium]|jgi:hypothetical protein|nr:hypothetical protein [Bacteroidales bacterium]MDD3272606.1 hypothetical protein [Bacteroidales bacterium]MDD4057409.1 hypothetical protein [Bacteroidales bacterium]
MDASTIIYIVLGLGALILQGYMEKKKKEQARFRQQEQPHDEPPEMFYEEQIREVSNQISELEGVPLEEYLDRAPVKEDNKKIAYEMIEIPPVSKEYGNTDLPVYNADEKIEELVFEINPRNLVLYSEIMSPKFRE